MLIMYFMIFPDCLITPPGSRKNRLPGRHYCPTTCSRGLAATDRLIAERRCIPTVVRYAGKPASTHFSSQTVSEGGPRATGPMSCISYSRPESLARERISQTTG